MGDLGRLHWEDLKWIMKYLNGSLDLGLLFQKVEARKDTLQGFVDSDFAGNID